MVECICRKLGIIRRMTLGDAAKLAAEQKGWSMYAARNWLASGMSIQSETHRFTLMCKRGQC